MSGLLAQSRVVELVIPGQEHAGGTGAWWIAGLVMAVALAIAAALWWRARRYEPAEAAFCKLARAGGMGRAQRLEVRALAERMDVKPVALLVSPSAMNKAISRRGGSD